MSQAAWSVGSLSEKGVRVKKTGSAGAAGEALKASHSAAIGGDSVIITRWLFCGQLPTEDEVGADALEGLGIEA